MRNKRKHLHGPDRTRHEMPQLNDPVTLSARPYQAPEIEIIDIEISQNILGGSNLPDMPFWDV